MNSLLERIADWQGSASLDEVFDFCDRLCRTYLEANAELRSELRKAVAAQPKVRNSLLHNSLDQVGPGGYLVQAAKRAEITIERTLLELAKIGYADIRKAVRWGEGIAIKDAEGNEAISNGVAMLDSAEIDDDTAAAIAEVAQTRDGIKIKFHDKLGALEKIGKHLGMFPTKVEMSGKDGGPIETVELSPLEAARRLAFAWEKGLQALKEKAE